MMPNKQFAIKKKTRKKSQIYTDFISSHKFGIHFPPTHF